MPALSSIAASDFSCSSAVNTGLRTSRSRSGLSSSKRVEIWSRSARTGVDGMVFERKLEQCGRIAAGHSGHVRIFPSHACAHIRLGSFPARFCVGERRKPLELKEDLDQAGACQSPARQNRGCANTAEIAVQYGRKPRRIPVLTSVHRSPKCWQQLEPSGRAAAVHVTMPRTSSSLKRLVDGVEVPSRQPHI